MAHLTTFTSSCRIISLFYCFSVLVEWFIIVNVKGVNFSLTLPVEENSSFWQLTYKYLNKAWLTAFLSQRKTISRNKYLSILCTLKREKQDWFRPVSKTVQGVFSLHHLLYLQESTQPTLPHLSCFLVMVNSGFKVGRSYC